MLKVSTKSQCVARTTIFFGAILAAIVSFLGQSDPLVLNPLIGLLIISSLFGFSFKFQINVLLRLSNTFLIGTLVNQVMLNSFDFTLSHLNVTLFWHFPVLVLFLIGFCVFFGKNFNQFAEIIGNFLIAGVVVCLHMISLFFMLSRTFGFGYENSLQVLINFVVFGIFLAVLVVVMADKVIFRGMTFILGCYFLALILIK